LLAQSKSLLWLNVAGNNIDSEGVENFSKNTTLVTLIASYNLLTDQGATILSHNTHLRELLLSYNQIHDAGAINLSNNTTLTELNLNYNYIGDVGMQALKQSTTLELLHLSREQPPDFTSENVNTTFLLSQDFLCIRNIDGTIEFFNPAFSRTLGYFDDELLGKSFYDFLHPDDYLAEISIDIHQKFPIYYHENRYRCKDGSYRWVRWSSETRYNRVYAVGSDITQQKKIERELIVQEKKIESELIKSKEAERYAEAQTDFIAHLCHEIRNPLSGVVGNVEVIQSHLETLQDFFKSRYTDTPIAEQEKLKNTFNELNECVESMKTCTDYQQGILDDNLDMARINEKKILLENKVFDLKEAAYDVIKMFKAKTEQKKIDLNLKLPEEELIVKGDIARIKKIIINLIGNAIKFTSSGYVNLTIAIQEQTSSHTWFEINVTDTGIGMTEEESSHLFERFAQVGATVGGQYGGSGLGLLIAKNLVQLMGGDIKVSSKKGEGSTFSCIIQCENVTVQEKKRKSEEKILNQVSIIPSIFQPPKKLHVSATEEAFTFKPGKVLIADDNEVNRKATAFGIRKAGYECLFAVDGQDVLDKYNEHKETIGIILMDVIMPKRSGIDATYEIRKLEKEKSLPRVPIIAITGNALETDKKKAYEVGVDDYVIKPFKSQEIINKIAVFLTPPKEREVNLLDSNVI
ncbi:MAG: response regulator, partial [Gammaproteobacteria bacterium]